MFDLFPYSGATILPLDSRYCSWEEIPVHTVLYRTPYNICRSMLNFSPSSVSCDQPAVLIDSAFSQEIYSVYVNMCFATDRSPLPWSGYPPPLPPSIEWDMGIRELATPQLIGSIRAPWPSESVDACVMALLEDTIVFESAGSLVAYTPVDHIRTWLGTFNLDLVPVRCHRSRRDLVETQRVAQRICWMDSDQLVRRWVLHAASIHKTQASILLP